jgi:tetratricopeptide (TPR) repeat protein
LKQLTKETMQSEGAKKAFRDALEGSYLRFRGVLQNEPARSYFVCLLLAATTLFLYFPITGHSFVRYDDDEYITANRHVTAGLTWAGVMWAFSTGDACNWHPLTWLSHMVDCQIYGLNPAGHYFTNLLAHLANTLLLFVLLSRVTRTTWRSAFVAALFALHPLHVESVAWASERKDVLSTLFFLLTLMTYSRYAELRDCDSKSPDNGTPEPGRPQKAALFFYCVSLLLFTAGLMAKPMVVTLPFVLLLVDYWPLRRFQFSSPAQMPTRSRLLIEKVPFFFLAVAASIITLLVQRAGGATYSLERIPVYTRLANAAMAYVRYLSKTFWPADLAVFYPYQEHWPLLSVALALVILLLVSTLCVLKKEHRYLFVGWFWFLGTLVPTIGLVQVGSQSMADRYMYIPSIGLFVFIVWGLNDASLLVRNRKFLLSLGAAAALCSSMICTAHQLSYWKNDQTLFQHAFEVTEDNYVAYVHLADAADAAGDQTRALDLCLNAVRIRPCFAEGHYNAGTYLMEMRRMDEAVAHLEEAIKINPRFARAHENLGVALVTKGRVDDAISHLSKAIELEPESPRAHYSLGTTLLKASKLKDAEAEISQSLRLDPKNAEAHMNLGVALVLQGQAVQALDHFAEAVRLAPNNAEARFNLGVALLEQKKPAEAAEQFTQELRLKPAEAKAHYRLALALVQLDQRDQAVSHYQETLRLAPNFSQAAQELALLKGSAPIQ